MKSSNFLKENKDLIFFLVFSMFDALPDIVPLRPSLAIIIVPLILLSLKNVAKISLFFFKDLTLINL